MQQEVKQAYGENAVLIQFCFDWLFYNDDFPDAVFP